MDESAIPASVGKYPLPGGETAADIRPSSIYSPKIRWLALVGIFLVSLNLRATVTSLSAIYSYMSPDLPGLGETATTPVAPAIANAIFAGTGARLRHLPIRLQAVLVALARGN